MYYHLFQMLQAYDSGSKERTAALTKENIAESIKEEGTKGREGDTFYGMSYRWEYDALRI